MGQYKKIAIIGTNTVIKRQESTKIRINTDFRPSKILLYLEDSDAVTKLWMDTEKGFYINLYGNVAVSIDPSQIQYDYDSKTLTIWAFEHGNINIIKQVIAIG